MTQYGGDCEGELLGLIRKAKVGITCFVHRPVISDLSRALVGDVVAWLFAHLTGWRKEASCN
jgi:hypothetical protein